MDTKITVTMSTRGTITPSMSMLGMSMLGISTTIMPTRTLTVRMVIRMLMRSQPTG